MYITHLLLPSIVSLKLLIIQASYCRITKLRAHTVQNCKKLNIRNCGFLQITSYLAAVLLVKHEMVVMFSYVKILFGQQVVHILYPMCK